MEIKPWTTYRDLKNRNWVVIDLIPFDSDGNFTGNVIHFIYIYEVGTNQNCHRVPRENFISYIEKGLMVLCESDVKSNPIAA